MAEQMHIPVLGLIENYSYLECPDCGKHISVFGESTIDQVAAELHLPVFAKMPIRPALARLSDAGCFEQVDTDMIQDAAAAIAAVLKTE